MSDPLPPFHAILSPDPNTSLWNPDTWGETVWQFKLKEGEHVGMVVSRSPEGFVAVLRCHCGGRTEILLDGRPLVGPSKSLKRLDEVTQQQMTELVFPRMESFGREHMGCGDPAQRKRWELSGEALRLLAQARDNVRASIKDGGDAQPHFLLLYGEHFAMLPVPMPPPDERGALFAAIQGSLRDHFRAIKQQPNLVIFISPAYWTEVKSEDWEQGNYQRPSEMPSALRREGVIMHVLTKQYHKLCTCPITRAVPGDESTPGTMGPVRWGDAVEKSRLTDGLFALDDLVPQDAETAERARGIPLPPLTEEQLEALADLLDPPDEGEEWKRGGPRA